MSKIKKWYDGIAAVDMIKYAAFLYIVLAVARGIGGIAGLISAAVK